MGAGGAAEAGAVDTESDGDEADANGAGGSGAATGTGGTAGNGDASDASGTDGVAGSGTDGGGGVAGAGGAGGAAGSGTGGSNPAPCDNRCEIGEACTNGTCAGGSSRWPTLGGNNHHSGFNPNEKGTPPLVRDWSVTLAASPLWPAVSDGKTIFVSQASFFSRPTTMWALAPGDGRELWNRSFGDVHSVGQPSVDGDHVYVAQCNHDPGTYMYSIVAATGNVFWSAPFGAQWEQYWAPLITPGGSVYFNGGAYGGFYGYTVAGSRMFFFNNAIEQYDEWSPAFVNGRLYTFVAGHLREHHLLTGLVTSTVSVTWTPTGAMQTSPISDGTNIYVIAPPNLHAIGIGQPRPTWTSNAAYAGMPAVANGTVYALSGSHLRAVDAATGTVKWTFPGDSRLKYPPVIAGRWVYVASDTNAYAVDTTSQAMAWTDTPGGWLSIATGRLLVAQPNGAVAAHLLTPPAAN